MTQIEGIDDHTIGLIASRVAHALREELGTIAAELGSKNRREPILTVVDVAERLGVARSTVYAHWREWGGYKPGSGQKTAIRFPESTLPSREYVPRQRPDNDVGRDRAQRRSHRRHVLRGTPRLPVNLGDDG